MKIKAMFSLKRKAIHQICLFLTFFILGGIVTAQNTQVFTPQELAKYNGQNGNRAYVAVNGLVYDLTDVPSWANGRHYCARAIAGRDITFLWKLVPPSHRDPAFLKRFPVVGRLIATKPQPSTSPTSPPTGGTPSLARTLILGLLIAVCITVVWIFIRLKKH